MSCDFYALANAGISALHPYQGGKPIEELQRELGLTHVVKLASNENPLPPGERVTAAIQRAGADIGRYPDGNGFALKAALAAKLGVSAEQITLGNGSNDNLELLARVFLSPQCSAVYSQYAFLVYALATQASGARAIEVPAQDWGHDLTAMAAAIAEDTRVVFLANPNNPTGTWFAKADLIAFLDKVPQSVVVVLDEAYIEYAEDEGFVDGVALLAAYPNLVVTRTFSKAYGLAGARIGYSISSAQIADLLNRARQPFNANSVAQAAAVAVLDDAAFLAASRQLNREGMAQLEAGFLHLGLRYIPSAGNFIAVELPLDPQKVYQQMLQQGVIVRPVAAYNMPAHLRISIGTAAENAACLRALAWVLGN